MTASFEGILEYLKGFLEEELAQEPQATPEEARDYAEDLSIAEIDRFLIDPHKVYSMWDRTTHPEVIFEEGKTIMDLIHESVFRSLYDNAQAIIDKVVEQQFNKK